MQIASATSAEIEQIADCLVAAFAEDPITGFLLGSGSGYPDRLRRFFSLLVRARISLGSPVLVARSAGVVHGAAMGNATSAPSWPGDLEEEWNDLESVAPGFNDRAEIYEAVAKRFKPSMPHFYLGVIGTSPSMQGLGIGRQLLRAFGDLSASDGHSGGVYLETANPLNVRFYEQAGFAVTGQGAIGAQTLWCMFLRHGQRQGVVAAN